VDLSKVGYSFLIILALTINFGFFWSEYNYLAHNHFPLLHTTAFVSTLCVYFIFQLNTETKEKFAFMGREILFITGLVASLNLWVTIIVSVLSTNLEQTELSSNKILSPSGGALLANLITTCIVVLDTLSHKENTAM